MDEREFFKARRKAERDVFVRVIRALPDERLDYRPHPKSPSAGELLRTLVAEHAACGHLAATGRADWTPSTVSTVEEAVAGFEKAWDELDRRVATLDDAGWARTGEFFHDGKKVFEQPVGAFLWFIFFDAIHHRGQLSAYIRPMGGTVPAIYGPSGDSKRP
jgi:uncharacterized damage-inducible protein DinB